MIIVSQDKDCIVNFDNIVSIGMEDFSDSSPWQRITAETLGTAVVLGDYKTEERAKEVIQEIIKEYSSYLELKGGSALTKGQMDIQPNIFNIPKVYYLPED